MAGACRGEKACSSKVQAMLSLSVPIFIFICVGKPDAMHAHSGWGCFSKRFKGRAAQSTACPVMTHCVLGLSVASVSAVRVPCGERGARSA